jgi:hypothetical protein
MLVLKVTAIDTENRQGQELPERPSQRVDRRLCFAPIEVMNV